VDHDSHLRHMNRLLTGLSRVNQAIFKVREDRSHLVREASRIIRDQTDYDVVWLGEINLAGEVLYGASEGPVLQAGNGQGEPDGPQAACRSDRVLGALRDVAVRAARDRTAIVSESLHPGTGSTIGTVTATAIPVAIDPGTTFILMVCRCGEHAFGSEEVDVLNEIAGNLGMAVEAMEVQARTQNAERALRNAEERFRRLAENSLVGIVLIQNDLYRYVNPAFADMFGYSSPRQIIDKLGPLDLAAPESRELVDASVQRRVLGQVRALRYAYKGLRRDGSVFEVEEHGARTVHANRLAVVATVIDVTAREASRRRLEALTRAGVVLSQAQTPQQVLELAVEQVSGILPCDAATVATFAAESHLPEHAVSFPPQTGAVFDLMASGDLEAWHERVGPLITAGEPATVVNATGDLSMDGRPTHTFASAPLVVRGELIGIMVVQAAQVTFFDAEDASHLRLFCDNVAATLQHLRLISSLEAESKRLQTLNDLSHTLSETLRLGEVASRALRHISSAIGAGVSILYLRDPNHGTFSAVAGEGLGQPTLEALDRALTTTSSTDAAASPHAPAFAHLISAVEDIDADAIATGLDVPLEAHGELVGTLTFLTGRRGFGAADTELARALAVPVALALQNARFYENATSEAETMTEALHRQEELDQMKDELIQNISHELRTPLSLVMGYAEMLADGELGALEPDQEAAVAVIARRSRMLRSLVEDIALLWHLERQSAQKDFVDLHEIVQVTAAEFQSRARETGLTLDAETPSGIVCIEAVPLQIRRVLDNLIGNSLKFTSPGGSITLALRADDGWAYLSVADSGIGVPREKLERIFDRFYQVDGSPRRKYGGTGLGLALVKAIVDTHGGTIVAESPISVDPARPGTRITVRLPLSAPPDDGS